MMKAIGTAINIMSNQEDVCDKITEEIFVSKKVMENFFENIIENQADDQKGNFISNFNLNKIIQLNQSLKEEVSDLIQRCLKP